jgi:hypothetical protein
MNESRPDAKIGDIPKPDLVQAADDHPLDKVGIPEK